MRAIENRFFIFRVTIGEPSEILSSYLCSTKENRDHCPRFPTKPSVDAELNSAEFNFLTEMKGTFILFGSKVLRY